ncbi:unnamed protein product [Rhizophagus irregularis]|nr:unnamed protein product [Rhizophagus irregularis]
MVNLITYLACSGVFCGQIKNKCGLAFNHQREHLIDILIFIQCWDYDPDMRPTIQEIVNTLTPMASQQIIQNLKNLKLNHGMFLNRHEIDRIYFRTIKYMHQFSCRYTADLSNYFRTELMEEHYVKHMVRVLIGDKHLLMI